MRVVRTMKTMDKKATIDKKAVAVIVTTLAVCLSSIAFTGCGKKKVVTDDSVIKTFSVDNASVRKPRETLPSNEDADAGDGLVYQAPNIATIDLTGDGNKNNNNSNVLGTKKEKEAELAELELKGNDASEYYAIVNKEKDIQFGAVTYVGLNSAVESIRQPYSKQMFINFIVKTYAPTRNRVLVSFVNEEDPGTVPEGMSMTISDSLDSNWEGYNYILTKYGTRACWMMTLVEADTYERPAFLYGCKDYIVYAGSNGVIQIDMNKYQDIKPFEDTNKYVAPDTPEDVDTSMLGGDEPPPGMNITDSGDGAGPSPDESFEEWQRRVNAEAEQKLGDVQSETTSAETGTEETSTTTVVE